MVFLNSACTHFKRDLSVGLLSFFLASCTEQRDAGSKMQFSYNQGAADVSVADSIFDAPSSVSR